MEPEVLRRGLGHVARATRCSIHRAALAELDPRYISKRLGISINRNKWKFLRLLRKKQHESVI